MPTINAGTPLYAAAFPTEDTIVVGGGGGQGAHGVKNKIILYKVRDSKPVEADEISLPANSDSVTTIATGSADSVYLGANLPTSSGISHLRVLIFDADGKFHADQPEPRNLFQAKDISVYQRSTSVSGPSVAISSSGIPAKVCVLGESGQVDLKFEEEVVGAAITAEDGKNKYIAIAKEAEIEIRDINAPNKAVSKLGATKGNRWVRIEAAGNAQFVAASTLGARAGASLVVFGIFKEKAKVIRTITLPFKGVTALAVSGLVVAAASPSGDIAVYRINTGKLIVKFAAAHKFPVTSLALSPSGTALVSTSLDGSMFVKTGITARSGLRFALAFLVFIFAVVVYIKHHSALEKQEAKVVVGHLHAGHGVGHGPVIQHLTKETDVHSHHGLNKHDWGHGPVVHPELQNLNDPEEKVEKVVVEKVPVEEVREEKVVAEKVPVGEEKVVAEKVPVDETSKENVVIQTVHNEELHIQTAPNEPAANEELHIQTVPNEHIQAANEELHIQTAPNEELHIQTAPNEDVHEERIVIQTVENPTEYVIQTDDHVLTQTMEVEHHEL